MRRRARALTVGAALVSAAVVGLLLTASSSGPTTVAPFSLPSLRGGAPVSVPVVDHGTHYPVVLNFFASWCVPCRTELPQVATVANQLTAAGTQVAFVGVDGNDDSASGLSFAEQSGVRFPIGADNTSVVAPRFGIPGYPATVFIDASGAVVHVVRGPVSPSTLRDWAERIALRH